MFLRRTVILHCGTHRASLGIFTSRNDRLRLEEWAEEVFFAGTGSEGHWLEQTRTALRKLSAKLKQTDSVVLVLPAHLGLTKFVKVPRVEAAQREKVIRFEAAQSLPVALADVVWGSVVATEQEQGLEVLLVAAKLEVVESLCAAMQAAGLKPRLILPAPLASLAVFRMVRPASAQPELILSIDDRATTLVQVEAARFFTRTFTLGMQDVSWQMAEKQDPVALETVATRIAQEITRSALHFRRQSDMQNPALVWLTGGAARLAGLVEALAAKLKVPVGRLAVREAIETGCDVTAEAELRLADLAGAAATQLLPGHPAINLLPPELRRHEDQRQRQPWLITAATLTVTALLPPLLHFRAIAAEARLKTDAIEREMVPLRERDARNRASLQQLGELKQQVAQLQGIHDRRVGWLNLLADLQERLVRVEDVWLERMSVASAPGTPLKLAVSGRMLDTTNPLAKVSPETFNRVKALLASIVDSPFVASIEAERFDNEQPGILKFDFVLVADPARLL